MARVDAFLKIGFKPLWNWHTPHSWDTLKAKYSLLRGQICEAGQFRNHGHEALIRLLQCLSWPRYPRDPHYPEKMPSSPKVLSSLHVHGKKHLTGQGPWETQQPLPAPTSRLPEGNHSQLFTSFFPVYLHFSGNMLVRLLLQFSIRPSAGNFQKWRMYPPPPPFTQQSHLPLTPQLGNSLG